jgi:hypothetical protein
MFADTQCAARSAESMFRFADTIAAQEPASQQS